LINDSIKNNQKLGIMRKTNQYHHPLDIVGAFLKTNKNFNLGKLKTIIIRITIKIQNWQASKI